MSFGLFGRCGGRGGRCGGGGAGAPAPDIAGAVRWRVSPSHPYSLINYIHPLTMSACEYRRATPIHSLTISIH